MSLTKIEVDVYRGAATRLDDSAFAMLNPDAKPGSLVFAGACAAKFSIASQVACRLSLQHFVESVMNYFGIRALDPAPPSGEGGVSLEVLEEAFRKANSQVYRFGHSLAAGGTMSATLIGLVIEDQMASSARAANGSAYLLRGDELFPFFDNSDNEAKPSSRDFVGERALITVDLASVNLEAGDRLLVLDRQLSSELEQRLEKLSREHHGPIRASQIAAQLFEQPEELPFLALIHIGPETVYLGEGIQ